MFEGANSFNQNLCGWNSMLYSSRPSDITLACSGEARCGNAGTNDC
jgi:hypothetical protein